MTDLPTCARRYPLSGASSTIQVPSFASVQPKPFTPQATEHAAIHAATVCDSASVQSTGANASQADGNSTFLAVQFTWPGCEESVSCQDFESRRVRSEC